MLRELLPSILSIYSMFILFTTMIGRVGSVLCIFWITY
jgi:hypothetical protein